MEIIIKNILDSSNKKMVQSYCKKILKKCSFNSNNDLKNVKNLATWLYVYGNVDEAMNVCDTIEGIPFTGNYDIWKNVELVCCLKARIYREQGNLDMRQQMIDKIQEHRHPELIKNLDTWYRDTLEINIKSSEEVSPKKRGYLWRIVKIQEAIIYREVGDSLIPDEELENDIKLNVDILKLL